MVDDVFSMSVQQSTTTIYHSFVRPLPLHFSSPFMFLAHRDLARLETTFLGDRLAWESAVAAVGPLEIDGVMLFHTFADGAR